MQDKKYTIIFITSTSLPHSNADEDMHLQAMRELQDAFEQKYPEQGLVEYVGSEFLQESIEVDVPPEIAKKSGRFNISNLVVCFVPENFLLANFKANVVQLAYKGKAYQMGLFVDNNKLLDYWMGKGCPLRIEPTTIH